MGLCTTDDVKNLLGSTSTAEDTLLATLIERASAQAARLAGVGASGVGGLVRTSTTLYPYDPGAPDGQTRVLRIPGAIESISSLKQRYSQSTAWTDVTALTEDTDYLITSGEGKVERINSVWSVGHRQLVQVTGVFGYDDPASPAGGDAIDVPADLRHAVAEQVQWLWRRKDKIGKDSITLGMGGAFNLKDMEVVQSLRDAVSALPFVRRL